MRLRVAVKRRPEDSVHRMFTRHTAFFKRGPSPTIILPIQTETMETEHAHTPYNHIPPKPQHPMHIFPMNLAPSPWAVIFLSTIVVTSRNALITGQCHRYTRSLNKSPWIRTY